MVCRRCGNNFNAEKNRQKGGSTKCPSCGAVYIPKSQSSQRSVQHRSQPSRRFQPSKNTIKHIDWKSLATKKIWKLPLWVWVVIFFAVITYPASKPAENKQNQNIVQQAVSQIPEPTAIIEPTVGPTATLPTATQEATHRTTGIIVTDFIDRFEKGMSHFGVPCTVTDKGFDENGYGMLAIDEHLALNYTLIDGKISDLFLFGSGDGSLNSGTRVAYAIASAMYGLDKNTIATETGSVIIDMINNGSTYTGANYVMSGSANDITGTTVVFSGTVR